MSPFTRTGRDPSYIERTILDQTSPFRNSDSSNKVRIFHAKTQAPHMGTVHTAEGRRYAIRIACQHWALSFTSEDCRHGCEKAAIEERAKIARYRK